MGSWKGHTHMEVGPDGVALITIVNPPVNSLSFDVLRSLKESFDQAIKRHDVKAIVVTGAKGKFSGGFDISAFGRIQEAKERPKPGWVSVEIITDTIEAARKPSVAAIDGLALGGGLEVAMACNARLSTPTAQLGLPELQLGIIPGFGGTQRLPRLVGLTKALEMILVGDQSNSISAVVYLKFTDITRLASKPVKGKEAFSLGLVDGLVSPNDLVNTARQWALDILNHQRPWVASLYKTNKLEPLGEAREILKFARAQARKRAPNLYHPLVCIDVIEAGIVAGPRAGLWKEAEAFEGLVQSDTCKSLVHVFFAQRGTTKVPGVTDRGLVPRQIKKVAILGGGLMGSGIATALILSNYPVILKEVNEKFLDAGINRIKANLQSRVKKGNMTKQNFEKAISLVKGSLDYESFRDVDMVIEAVIENVSLKQQIFADLEKYCPPHCILASNTSTIDLNMIGEKIKSKDRIVGAHFFSPAHVMPLLEIVRTKQTSPQVIVDVLDISKKIKKTPVVVGNCTGFAVNRMFFPYTQAGLLLVERGADVYQIDRVITKFGMPMGPFRLVDLVGFGVAIATGSQFIQNFPERTYKSMLIPLLQEDKRAGETTRKGFYLYDDKRKASPDPELKNYIEKARGISGVSVDPKLAKLQEKDIVEMIFFPVVNEACRVLDEGIAVKAADLDISAIMGMGFPPYRGGIIFWADSLGSKYIYSRLEKWSELYGEFFKPCAYLAARAAKGIPLVSWDCMEISAPVEQAKSRIQTSGITMGSRGHTLMEVGPDGVAVITIVNPPVNSLSYDGTFDPSDSITEDTLCSVANLFFCFFVSFLSLVLRSFKQHFDQALRRDDVKAFVVTGAKGKFSGGFDISAFGDEEPKERPKPGWLSVEIITDTIEAARKPLVAAIDGLALGGGLEFAMACNARLSTPTAQLGLPELQLGIIPGLGGTQRLPRLVGLAKALEMMLTSKPVKGKEAFSLGLVDGLVSPDDLVKAARQWALDIVGHQRPWIATLYKTDKLEPLGEAVEILKFARAQAQKRAPNLQHPLVCIDVIEAGVVAGPRAGLWKEAEASEVLVKSDTCKSLIHIFFAQRGTSKIPGVTDRGLVPRNVKKVAILGGGLMGSGIATALILSSYPVILKEVNDKFLDAGINRIKANLQSRVTKGKLTQENFEKAVSLLKGTLDYESFRDVDMVIEAVIENVSLKQQIFTDVEKHCPPHCILASNTSTIDLNLIGERTKSKDRIVGAHFFSPAHVMPLLEIVRTNHTSPQVIVDVLNISKKIKKTPVVVGNCTGFAVNRMFFPYTQAGLLLVERGADFYQIDKVISKFGMPMGPFRLVDLVGFGVAIATGMQFIENFPERTYKSMLIPLLQEDKRAGETTRKGFYLYDDKRKASPDSELKNYIEKARSITGVSVDPKLVKLQEKDIIEMIFFPVVNEACRVLGEGIAVKAADLDIASVMGMGFPPYRGGIIFWADTLGSKYIYSKLEKWSELYGEFFKPCSYLAVRAAEGIPLSATVEQANSRL
ncbi:unnamed protein product [Sphenostylis stenocarpa]|uniref:Enoyl-CoA hydratase n=2 Tax=Magnoliopsida TaxID=3398 RepID=A0AA86VXK2_9FABA|nr:unnamed protein product [Sphenostylis stenocarpa]